MEVSIFFFLTGPINDLIVDLRVQLNVGVLTSKELLLFSDVLSLVFPALSLMAMLLNLSKMSAHIVQPFCLSFIQDLNKSI